MDDHQEDAPDYYLNEKGLLTFTAYYLFKRGSCCGSGCRHCPYDYDNLPEPMRQLLLEQRKNRSENGE